jgi:uncharacterized membrane protein YheB (UPF0754 family)
LIAYILLPVIAGLIGWFTNFIAVKMLFRPRNPVKILGLTIQGIFPKRQKYLAVQLGKLVAEQLLSNDDIQKKITQSGNLKSVVEEVENKIDDYLLNTFPEKYPITSMFFGAKRKAQIKVDLMDEVEVAIPQLISGFAGSIGRNINIEEMVQEKVENLDPAQLEILLNGILKKEFKFIEWIGAILGFLIGLLQVLITILTH